MEIYRLNLYIRDQIGTKRSGDTLSMCKLNLVVRRKFKNIRGVGFLKHFPERIVGGYVGEKKLTCFEMGSNYLMKWLT